MWEGTGAGPGLVPAGADLCIHHCVATLPHAGWLDRQTLSHTFCKRGGRLEGFVPCSESGRRASTDPAVSQVWDPGCIETSPGTSGGEVTSSTTDPNRT